MRQKLRNHFLAFLQDDTKQPVSLQLALSQTLFRIIPLSGQI